MTVIKELQHRERASHQVWRGTIASDASDLSDMVYVIVPGFDANFRWGPCRWQARDLTSLPSRGDECVLVLDDRGEGWVIAWWPF